MNIPLFYYFIALILFIVLYQISRKTSFCLLSSYLFLIFVSTVLNRKSTTAPMYEFSPFWYFRGGKINNDLFNQLKANIAMYIPVGLLGSCAFGKPVMTTLFAFLSSAFIELLQFVFHKGQCEVSDVINNMIGAVIGSIIYSFIIWFRKQIIIDK